MCCAEFTGGTPVRTAVGHRVVLNFRLHEVQPERVLLRYVPGDTMSGESFTRSTAALQKDASDIYQTAAINAKRDSHYVGGVRSILLEDTRANSCIQSYDLTTAAWTGAATVAINAVGLQGTPNAATTLTDNSAGAVQIRTPAAVVSVTSDNAKHTAAVWIKKDSDTTRFPAVYAYLSGGSAVDRRLHLNTQTGAVTSLVATGTSTFRVIDDGLWWIVEIVLTNNTSGNVNFSAEVSPANGTVFGTTAVAAQGSCIVGNVQLEKNAAFVSSPILTTTVAVTRGADLYSVLFATPPQEMTAYAKFVELGSITVSGTIFDISNAASASPRLLLIPAGGFYATHHNNVTTVNAPLAVAPANGDVVELLARLFDDGSVDTSQSIAGAATTASALSAALTVASAWSGELCWLNSAGTAGAVGFIAIQQFKIIAASKGMAEMRTL